MATCLGTGAPARPSRCRWNSRPGEEKTIALLVGYAGDAETRARLKQAYLDPAAAEREFGKVWDYWRKLEEQPQIETPIRVWIA